MTLRELTALMSAVLVIAGTIWYIRLTLLGRITPVLASWIVVTGTMNLSLATYWTTPNPSIVSGGANASGAISCLGILLAILWQQGVKAKFSRFQKQSLLIATGIAVLWLALVFGFKKTGTVPNILTQILMLIGYVVTAEKLWRAKRNSESFFTWWAITIACAIALYPAIESSDWLAVLYASRGALTSAIVIWLMYRAQRKECLEPETT